MIAAPPQNSEEILLLRLGLRRVALRPLTVETSLYRRNFFRQIWGVQARVLRLLRSSGRRIEHVRRGLSSLRQNHLHFPYWVKSDEGYRGFLANYMDKESVTINDKQAAIPEAIEPLILWGFVCTISSSTMTLACYQLGFARLALCPKFPEILTRIGNCPNGLALRRVLTISMLTWLLTAISRLTWPQLISHWHNFGNYKHPLMVDYAGQMKMCWLCHVSCLITTLPCFKHLSNPSI